ncbi:TetR/AcrR family transcriptional regulator [Agrobacterium vitis]|uniref:TetR/AcrR family transcriptional regulator n=1 Tax=Allorhizobium ampelinum TaxID=3025782 RepID=UPI001F1B02BA|nr:TetR/AcrR family transcriptional regulator [Allorhizobium ampelinum]MCF1464582.1 TetR/AcrR family transcriptional regulator [Allorhizobium ampelinum]
MSENSREKILETATRLAQAHGYGGLNIRDLAAAVGIKAASIYYHFPGKAELAAAVAHRYWEYSVSALEEIWDTYPEPLARLRHYPETFRYALERENRMCMASFMGAEYDDLPDIVKSEVQVFSEVNIAWLRKTLLAAEAVEDDQAEARARAVFAAVVGAQLMARSRADIALYDALIDTYRSVGLIPG